MLSCLPALLPMSPYPPCHPCSHAPMPSGPLAVRAVQAEFTDKLMAELEGSAPQTAKQQAAASEGGGKEQSEVLAGSDKSEL